MEDKITIVCSDQNPDDNYRKHVIKSCGIPENKIQFLFYENKGEFSLTQIYNRGLKEGIHNIICYLHSDLILPNNWGNKVFKHFKRNPEFGIIGVAGTDYLIDGRWWSVREAMHGIVQHTDGIKTWTSKFSQDQGNSLKEMIVLDGLFFAVDKRKIVNTFNEEFKGFHFYDISFCLENYIEGVKLGVCTDIKIIHKSIGITNNQWEENKKQFETKYGSLFPLRLNKTFFSLNLNLNSNG